MSKNLIVPDKVQKLLNKNKILEETDCAHDHTWWLKSPDLYEEPRQINQIEPGWYLHIGNKGPHCIEMRK